MAKKQESSDCKIKLKCCLDELVSSQMNLSRENGNKKDEKLHYIQNHLRKALLVYYL